MKNRTALIFTLFLLSAGISTAQEYTPKFDQFTLPNGLSVILHRDTTLPLISINMTYHAGSAIDPKGHTGLANIAGEMLLLGTKEVPREELLRLRDEEQVSISALTTVDWVGIASVFPMNRLETALMIEADRMQHSVDAFSQGQFDNIVAGLKKEHARRDKQALGKLTQQVFHELYAEGHPYRHISIGETEDVDSIGIADVKRFGRRYHVPANAYLTVGGNFDAAAARSLIEKYFSRIPAGQPAGWTSIPDTFTPIGQGAFVVEDRIGFNQLHLVFPTVRAGHVDEPVLKLIAKLLTGSQSALLYTNLVNVNPLIHSVEVSQSSNELTGTFWITVTCKLETHLTTVYDQIMRVLDAVAKDGASEEELKAARNQSAMEFYSPLEAFYGFGGRCDMMNLGNMLGDSPLFSFTLQQNQQKATSASIRRAASTYLTTGNQLVISVLPIGKTSFAVTIN